MNCVILLEPKREERSNEIVRFAMDHPLLGPAIREDMIQNAGVRSTVRIYAPAEWKTMGHWEKQKEVRFYDRSEILRLKEECRDAEWIVVKKANVLVQYEQEVLQKLFFQDSSVEMYAVNVSADRSGFGDQVRRTSQGSVAGFRRFYHDSVRILGPMEGEPQMLWIRGSAWEKTAEQVLGEGIEKWNESCRSGGVRLLWSEVEGNLWDLETARGLLSRLNQYTRYADRQFGNGAIKTDNKNGGVAANVQLFGDVILGTEVEIGEGTVIVGPSVIGDRVRIGEHCLIHSSVIGSGKNLKANRTVLNQVMLGLEDHDSPLQTANSPMPYLFLNHQYGSENGARGFRTWPDFSYPRFWKRLLDIFMAVNVLLLFIPIFPFIALAIKLNSKGPVFFPHKRQGLHGRKFFCWKARTMIPGADQWQQKLRGLNQVDGPQFMMEDDPRVSTVGKFLRDTCLDEIPQFINVLKGEMSVVGPRPSPKRENSTCPPWRDARLSVRPGITGLWQVCRTRREGQDFQEWVFYDIDYVKHISLKMDLWICWKTVQKMLREFARHF